MKTISIISILIIFCIDYSAGQKRDTIYYDKNWVETKSKNFEFYRIAFLDRGLIRTTDYYKSGKIQMTGTYRSFNYKDPTGQFLYYKKNGHFESQTIYEPYKYPDLISPFKDYIGLISPLPDSFSIGISYRPNGSIWGIGYESDSCACKSRYIYLSAKGYLYFQMSYLNQKKDGRYIQYFANKKGIVGQFKAGKRTGEWIFYNRDGTIRKTINYDNNPIR
jgi:antitoxin component YwqK of YwqJK toxin-antitoxin module